MKIIPPPSATYWDELILSLDVGKQLEHWARLMEGTFFQSEPDLIPLRPVILAAQGFDRVLRAGEAAVHLVARSYELHEARKPGELERLARYHEDTAPFFLNGAAAKKAAARMARPDIIIQNGLPRVVEVNVGTALGGALEIHQMNRHYADSPAGRATALRFGLSANSPIASMVAFYRRYAREQGLADPPVTGILEWEFNVEIHERMAAEMRVLGLPTSYINPDHLRERNGRLLHMDQELDIGIKHYHLTDLDLPEDTPFLQPLFQATAAEGTHLLSHDTATLISDKTLLAYLYETLTDFSEQEQSWIRDYIPWTARLTQDLAESRLNAPARSDYVLKPGNRLQGEGVYVGADMTVVHWESAVREALADGSYLVQDYCAPDLHPLPFYNAGHIEMVNCPAIFGPFVIDKQADGGILARVLQGERRGAINHHTGALVACVFREAGS